MKLISVTSNLSPKIIYQDHELLILDKPAGLVVNRDRSVKEKTLQDWIEDNFQFPIFNFQKGRSGIVHRLDKETSGVLVAAKTPNSFSHLLGQFKQRQIKKKYLALVYGKVFPREGEISLPIARSRVNRKKFAVSLVGKKSYTRYRLLINYPSGPYGLLAVWPTSGRTHQIRVHLKSLGYPVVGDKKYSGRKQSRSDRQWCPRQFLHACQLKLIHPQKKKELSFSSPLPKELKKVLEMIGPGEKI